MSSNQSGCDSRIRHVVIAGGGSAGWLCAGIIAAAHQPRVDHPGLQVTLIESPDVAPIGVGEGTWPSMRATLRKIGIAEADFVRECDASFKQGSRFNGWVDGSPQDFYFHPFAAPAGDAGADLVTAWHSNSTERPFAEMVSTQPGLCLSGKGPKQFGTPEYAAVSNYGYHLDATKLGLFLRRHCVDRLGVRHVSDHIVAIKPVGDGTVDADIAALETREHGAIAADLFIDCTGMQSLLLGKHYDIPLQPMQQVLFNNSALAVQVAYPTPRSAIASQTNSTAQSCGWVWDIGLPTRRGIGYVYSSAHCSDDQAEQVLRDYLASHDATHTLTDVRQLRFSPGYRRKFWHRNCVAIGQSAGFIEPLEASALVLVELAAALVSEQMPATRASMDILANRFNQTFTYRWERVVEFLKLHYVLSRRTDSPYWLDNHQPETIPERLRELLILWQHHMPSHHDFTHIAELFPAASYQYILYGMGFRSELPTPAPDLLERARRAARDVAGMGEKMAAALPSNRELIDHILQFGMHKI